MLQLADSFFGSERGLKLLSERAWEFNEAGLFSGGAWADPSKLLPPLVRGSLDAGGVYPVLEGMSELRVLALAEGRASDPRLGAEAAGDFLAEVLALNLDLIFPAETEARRVAPPPWQARAERLFRFLSDRVGFHRLGTVLHAEVEALCSQRPINTAPARKILEALARVPAGAKVDERLEPHLAAICGATPLAREAAGLVDYRERLSEIDAAALDVEARAFGASLRATGLSSPYHSVLIRRLAKAAPESVSNALSLSELGRAELKQNEVLAHQLIKVAILPTSWESIYGFARLLERALLSRPEVAAGLRRLVELDLHPRVKRSLLAKRDPHQGARANSILVAGAISVLGQPLGVGQGANPTCQAARGLSLWSQHAPGHLLDLVASAARDDLIQVRFEEVVLRSDQIESGVAEQIVPDLDPVSTVLVPHLDRVYDSMMRRVALRTEDGHRWANPALYGRWVPHGFAALIDKETGIVSDFDDFVRRFYATHHPAFNDGHELIYPNPVGLFVTNAHGQLLGRHAVSLQRVARGPDDALRAYFYNPNNDGRQDWGCGVRPSTAGQGEEEGESSLPFADFVARLYAFHYNPYEEGDAYAVPRKTVRAIEHKARESWGRALTWDAPPTPLEGGAG